MLTSAKSRSGTLLRGRPQGRREVQDQGPIRVLAEAAPRDDANNRGHEDDLASGCGRGGLRHRWVIIPLGAAAPAVAAPVPAVSVASDEAPPHPTSELSLDVSFLLTELTGPRSVWEHACIIDPSRIGMAGHSIGGDATLATMLADRRILAGANLDGPITPPVPATGIDRSPVLLIAAADPSSPDIVPTWTGSWPNLDGWKRWLTVTGAGPLHLHRPRLPGRRERRAAHPGRAPRSIVITTSYVSAFFQRQFNAIPEPLLSGPDPAFPEVTFNNP